jgi:hypothetical protein
MRTSGEGDKIADNRTQAVAREREAVTKCNGFGNAAAMREALVQCELFLGNVSRHGHPTLNPGDKCTACDGVDKLRGMVVRALSAPARQCDVGTAEEQSVRMSEFCREQYDKADGIELCSGCRFYNMEGLECQFAWAQTPYAEEGDGDGE